VEELDESAARTKTGEKHKTAKAVKRNMKSPAITNIAAWGNKPVSAVHEERSS
jgi:hypothetical protein